MNQIVEIQKKDMENIAPLFAGWPETMAYSCLEGHMGRGFADDAHLPRSGQIVVGDFVMFAGEPDDRLVQNVTSSGALLIPRHEGWERMIEAVYGNRVRRFYRFATKKDTRFDKAALEEYANRVPHGYRVQLVDEEAYQALREEDWSRDLCGLFADYPAFAAHGIGVVAMHGGRPASGAGSYSYYSGGIEIEVDTHVDHRQKGLGQACCARLILSCLHRGLYPSWDAHDERSLRLAKRLGYELDHAYPAYEFVDESLLKDQKGRSGCDAKKGESACPNARQPAP